MNCETIIHRHPSRWVDDRIPFLLWELGAQTVVEKWVDVLFDTKGTLVLWLEEPDAGLVEFLSARFPLCERSRVRLGPPPAAAGDASTFLDETGAIKLRLGEAPRRYLPDQDPLRTWFAMVQRWLADLRAKGSPTPEIEKEIQPGVYASHHTRISPRATFHPPCWIGHDSEIGACALGPHAVVGNNCIVADGTRLADSYVLSNTYVGRGLVLEGLVAGASHLLQHQTGTRVTVTDGTLMRKLRE